ncbi:MAG: pilus assembly PilX N-terminal domain-containing protein [Nitrospirae bacterium]|nr:pilus assembly PilX N-terminal domain-containing protein [Nitrospirota bacterium]MCL5977854.1 pilus assembly PilX N-terminal domain-containing protein [Nitrospirota bacterium]
MKRVKRYKDIIGNQKGVALVTGLLMLVLLTAMGLALTNTSMVESWLSFNYRTSKQAFYAAEAGIQDAISRIVSETIYDNAKTSTTWNSGNSYSSTNFTNSFSITHWVVKDASGNNVVAATSDGNPYYKITSEGTSGTAKRTVEAVFYLEYNSVFEKALVGCDGVKFSSNGKTSSYSSTGNPTDGKNGDIGTVNNNANIELNSNADIKGDVNATGNLTMNSNAVVQKNAYANGNITMDSNAEIGAADKTSPYSYEAKAGGNITKAGNATVYGTESPNTSPSPVPAEPCDPLNVDNVFSNDAAPIQTTNNNVGAGGLNTPFYNDGAKTYNISSNNTDTIGVAGQSKDYYLTSFSMDSNAVVTVQGDVTMYVNGNFSMNSNTQIIFGSGAKLTIYVTGTFTLDSNTDINNNIAGGQTPSNLTIYSNNQSLSNSDYKINLKSNSGFRGTIYAPKTAIEVNSNASIYGAMRGRYVDMKSNGDFKYDEELGKIENGGTPEGYKLLYWQEKYN